MVFVVLSRGLENLIAFYNTGHQTCCQRFDKCKSQVRAHLREEGRGVL